MPLPNKKSIYHSDVVAFSGEGGTGNGWIQFSLQTAQLTLSRNKTDYYCKMVIPGDTQEVRFLQTENPQIGALISSLQANKTYWMRPSGTRESAAIVVMDEAQNEMSSTDPSFAGAAAAPQAPAAAGPPPAAAGPGTPPAAGPPPQGGPPAAAAPAGNGGGPVHVQSNGPTISRVYWEAVETGAETLELLLKRHEDLRGATPDAKLAFIHSAAAHMAIEFHRKGGQTPIRRQDREPGEEG